MDTLTSRARLNDTFPESVHAAALAVTFIAICYAFAMFVIGDPDQASAIAGIAGIAG